MKIPVIFMFVLVFPTSQVNAFDNPSGDRGDYEDLRDPRGDYEDLRDPRGDYEDLRGPHDDYQNNASDDRPWREILKNCREMKKAGTLSAKMKRECKAARELRKTNKELRED